MPEPAPDLTQWRVLIGRVRGRWAQSLLRIQPFTATDGYFAAGGRLCLAPERGEPVLVQIRSSTPRDKGWICDLGLPSQQAADALLGSRVLVTPEMRPPLPEGEFYLDDIFGMRVVTEAGQDLGEVQEILETPAHNVYVTPRAMIPAHAEFILETDWEQRVLKVRDVPGLRGEE